MAKKIKVSVICITYNQEQFIKQTIESFLSQKTNFLFEVIIADDASADATPKIINQYFKVNPEKMRPILRKKNIGIQDNLFDAIRHAKGEYIALCEGDDFWTDPAKLQRQVDFLDTHADYALCFHPVKVFFESNNEPDSIFPSETKGFTVKKLLDVNYIQTNSVMYRAQPSYDNLVANRIMPIDWYLHLYHTKNGKIGFINTIMSAYRRHPNGVWWNSYKEPSQIWEKHGSSYVALLHEIMVMYGSNEEYKKIILQKHIAGSFEAMAKSMSDNINDVAVKAIEVAPVETWDYIKLLIDQVKYHSAKSTETEQLLDQETRINKSKDEQIKQLTRRLESITSSKAWKLVEGYRKVNSRVKGENKTSR